MELALLEKELHSLYIFSDSQAAILKVKDGFSIFSIRARNLIKALKRKKIEIKILWVPSHIGIIGNEIADRLAKQGLEKRPKKEDIYISISSLKRKAKEGILKTWVKNWALLALKSDTRLGKQYQKICRDSLSFKIKPSIPAMARRHQSAYIQLKTGIGYLRAYQKVIGNTEDNRCRCRKGKESTYHLLLYCQTYKKERKEMGKALKGLPLSL